METTPFSIKSTGKNFIQSKGTTSHDDPPLSVFNIVPSVPTVKPLSRVRKNTCKSGTVTPEVCLSQLFPPLAECKINPPSPTIQPESPTKKISLNGSSPEMATLDQFSPPSVVIAAKPISPTIQPLLSSMKWIP